MSLQRLLNLEIAWIVFFTTHMHFTKESLYNQLIKEILEEIHYQNHLHLTSLLPTELFSELSVAWDILQGVVLL